jgi:hypothetical protein
MKVELGLVSANQFFGKLLDTLSINQPLEVWELSAHVPILFQVVNDERGPIGSVQVALETPDLSFCDPLVIGEIKNLAEVCRAVDPMSLVPEPPLTAPARRRIEHHSWLSWVMFFVA